MEKKNVALLGVIANIFLAIIKITAGIVSGYTAVLAEGIHSAMDVFSSSISYVGIRIAEKPADKEHPYGHYKFEVLAGLIITIILLLTGIWIIYEAYLKFMQPVETQLTTIALGVMLITALINEGMARLKIKVGKKENSVSLISDGMHSRIDVYSSIAVFAGLLLANIWLHVDSLLAALLGLYIIKESFEIGKEATDSLLDVSAGEEIENKIREIVREENIEIGDLKTLKRGSAVTANMEIVLPKNLSVEEATRIANNLREKLMNKIENLKYVAIQIASHDIEKDYYRPKGIILERLGLMRGFGWQRRGRFKGELTQARGLGPGGYCICPKCNYKVEHRRGIPCATLKCPKCGTTLVRSDS
ncbi:MAG: cation transporter [Candidatus Diapherotrites archaeon]|nr:cation transporter [Candidatus Diapherotrites archaeon]